MHRKITSMCVLSLKTRCLQAKYIFIPTKFLQINKMNMKSSLEKDKKENCKWLECAARIFIHDDTDLNIMRCNIESKSISGEQTNNQSESFLATTMLCAYGIFIFFFYQFHDLEPFCFIFVFAWRI